MPHSRRAIREESGSRAMRKPASNPSPIKSTVASLKCRSIETSGYCARNSGSSGATAFTPNDIGTARRTKPRGVVDCASVSFSASSPSASSCAARVANRCPASVSATRREVRLNSRAPSRSSSRLTALETVAFDSASSPAAAANERNSTTFAKIARASKSGSFAIALAHQSKMETMSFNSFYFYPIWECLSRTQRKFRTEIARNSPMIEVKRFAKLGHADHGWLNARHHFSFADYFDPRHTGHGALRVWNDDEIAPNTGFPAHPHANMEIITYVREGAISHQDSLGNKGRTEAGDVQVMSAGHGIRHSEYNLEPTKTKIFQIWIEPNTHGGQPTWGAKPFPKANRSNGKLVTIASGLPGDKDALPIRADARGLAP